MAMMRIDALLSLAAVHRQVALVHLPAALSHTYASNLGELVRV